MIQQLFPKYIQDLSEITAFIAFPKASFYLLEFDSRDVSDYKNTLFVCLKGQKSDGHQYIEELIELGVQNFLVSDKKYVSDKANFYFCTDTVLGFQKIARALRDNFRNPLVAISGSNGKTIVKEW